VGNGWGRSRAVTLTTDSWRDSDGKLYAPNSLVPVNLPSLKIVGQSWLISEVTYRKGENGTQCDLVLMPPPGVQCQADSAAVPDQIGRCRPRKAGAMIGAESAPVGRRTDAQRPHA
jgi:prophage tail gpP-like protein